MRSGFVSILGRPNAGKSTLLNALVGEKVAIVTNKPQTTRTRIHGILEVAGRKGKHAAAQIVFVDTPGVHKPGSLLDKRMMQEVHDALEHRDVVLLMVDATRRFDLTPAGPGDEPASAKAQREQSEDEFTFELISKLDCPVFLLINKIDLINRETLVLLISQLSAMHKFTEVIPISARRGTGLDVLVEKLVGSLPEGERYFPKDQFTDQPERFLVAELIREKILTETGEEVPYASAVVVERFEEPPVQKKSKKKPKLNADGEDGVEEKLPLTHIAAAIYCERAGQKAILIGKGGAKLKSIGAAARKEIESLLGTRVYLELFVTVKDNWRESASFIESLDWRRQLEDIAASAPREAGPRQKSPKPGERSTAKPL
ncbi:MAG TPA: GTPase Era [Acidisarcina sp.]